MKILSISLLLFFTVAFSSNIVAQDIGAIKKISGYSIPEKVSAPTGDPLPAGTYSIGTGGYFQTIDSAFNKLSIDGIAGEVTLELIDNLYTAPTDNFGFILIGPITGAAENSRVIIKPAQNHQVTIEGDGGAVLSFSNISYVTLDGVTLTGSTSLQINSFHNSQFTWNEGVDFLDNSDHNIVTTINFNNADDMRPSAAIGFWTNSSGVVVAPDSNLIENNNIVQACLAIYVSASNSNVYGFNNIIRNNLISAPSGFNISWGIQLEKNENTIVENNVVNNITNSVANLELALGINAHWCNSCIIRNNIVHSVSSNVMNGSTGILLSGIAGKEGYDNMIYNNMIFDIESTSGNPSSRVTGIQTWHNHNPRVYYNSIHLSGTGSNYMGSGALFIRTNTTNMEFCDNIFVNTRDESPYCAASVYVYTYPTILTSDYNDLYYQPNQYNCLVTAAGGDYLNLEEWQTTGNDVHGISEMPNFTDLLHIDENIPTNLESGATPIYGIDTDLDGDLRNAMTPDIGADEFDGLAVDTLYVPGDYSTIQAAIDAAAYGNIVLVAEDTYYENINFKGKAITVASQFLVDGDTSHITNTIINGSQPMYPDSASVVTFRNGEDTNSVICGFTITGGTGTVILYSGLLRRVGGGVFAYYSDAKIQNNIIESNIVQNMSDSWGGGICGFTGNYIIENNIIRDNEINTPSIVYYSLGGGIYTSSTAGYVRIANNKIINNTITAPEAWGGGIIPAGQGNDNYFIMNNLISGNTLNSTAGGSGGIDIFNHSPTVMNNVIVNNSAPIRGGGAVIENANPVFSNNTIAYNTSAGSGGGLDIVGSIPQIMNCILWGNSAPVGSQINGTANVSFSDVQSGYTGSGNIDSDPLFRDIQNNDFHLMSTDCGDNFNSPCIDAGNPAFEDLIMDCNWGLGSQDTCDMGAYSIKPLSTGIFDDNDILPDEYNLSQNYPNPFNPSTKIKYSIPQSNEVIVKIFDVLGKEMETLVKEYKPAGTYELTWNAENLPSGVYFYQLKAGDFIQTKKMILLK